MITKLKQRWWNYYFVGLMGIATVCAGVINYLYHPLMVRYLSESDFGLFESLMSFFNVITVIFAWFSLYLTQQVSIHREHPTYINTLYHQRTKWMIYGWGIVMIIVMIGAPWIQQYLRLPSVRPVIGIAMSLVFTSIGIVYSAILQGRHQFEYMAVSGIVGSILRVAIGMGAVALWYGLYGAVIGVILSGIIVILLQRYWLSPIRWGIPLFYDQKEMYQTFMHEKYTIMRFCIVMMVSIGLTNMDILIVQNLFGVDAISYIALAVVAKFLIFLWSAIETVYYPQLTTSELTSDTRIQLRNYIVMVFVMIWGAYIGASLLGHYVLELFKPWLWDHIGLFLRLLLLSGGIFLFTSLLKLFVAWKRYKIVFSLVLSSIISMVVLQLWSYRFVDYTMSEFVFMYTVLIGILVWLSIVLLLYRVYRSYDTAK